MNQFSKKTLLLINVIFAQCFVVLVSVFWEYVCKQLYSQKAEAVFDYFLMLSGVVLTVTAVLLVQEILRLAQKEKEAEVSAVQLVESKEMVDLLRTQRHDFLNHLQVISGLVQLKKYSAVNEYIKDIAGEMGTASRISNLKRPELAALLAKKAYETQRWGITMDFQIESYLEHMGVPPAELVSIVSNLLDNAIQAVKDVEEEYRSIGFVVMELEGEYILQVKNYGSPIPSNICNSVFDKGFSTKEGTGRGYGLHIVKTLIEKNRGTIRLTSSEEDGTTFTIRLPLERAVVIPLTGRNSAPNMDNMSIGGR